MRANVWVLGGAQTDFARNEARAGEQQADGARTLATLDIGGSTATAVSLVIRGEER